MPWILQLWFLMLHCLLLIVNAFPLQKLNLWCCMTLKMKDRKFLILYSGLASLSHQPSDIVSPTLYMVRYHNYHTCICLGLTARKGTLDQPNDVFCLGSDPCVASSLSPRKPSSWIYSENSLVRKHNYKQQFKHINPNYSQISQIHPLIWQNFDWSRIVHEWHHFFTFLSPNIVL